MLALIIDLILTNIAIDLALIVLGAKVVYASRPRIDPEGRASDYTELYQETSDDWDIYYDRVRPYTDEIDDTPWNWYTQEWNQIIANGETCVDWDGYTCRDLCDYEWAEGSDPDEPITHGHILDLY